MKKEKKHSQTESQDLRGFYEELLAREGQPACNLVAPWDPDDARAVAADFRQAFTAGRFSRATLGVGTRSPQAIGNLVGPFISKRLNKLLHIFTLEPCDGPGFPDYRLVRQGDAKAFVLELKTTSKSETSDSRVVLTSASQKLRTQFEHPTCHLVVTACYSLINKRVHFRRLRLNFLDPGTLVQVRLEVSLTPRLLLGDSGAVWIG